MTSRFDAGEGAEAEEGTSRPAGIRLEGYRMGNPSHFCLDCWEDRPEDFADAPGETLSRMQAQGHVCEICERALVGEEG